MPDPTNPQGQAPPPPDHGASPEEIQQALNMYWGLNNLDTRGETLKRIVRPDYDGHVLRQFVGEPAEPQQEPDPWQQFEEPEPLGYAPDGTPVYAQPPQEYGPAGFNPRELEPVFDQYGNQLEQRIFARLGEMAQEQAFKDSASQAASASGLPGSMSALIEQRAREAQRMAPNRQIGDLANEAARSIQTELLQWKATPPENPQPTGSPIPSGPVPSTRETPKTFEELAAIRAREMSQ